MVYRALDPLIGRLVAIKVIRLREINDPADREFLRHQLFREARSAGTLSHSGIVTIYQIGEQDGLAYIAMEHVAGVTLDKLMAGRAPLARELVRKVAEQAAGALDHAYRKGIVHRDIKPPNLMLERRRQRQVLRLRHREILRGRRLEYPDRNGVGHASLHGAGASRWTTARTSTRWRWSPTGC